MVKGKNQLDGPERVRIEVELAMGTSCRQIAKKLGRSLSTIVREIRKHSCISFKGCYGRFNQCLNRVKCAVTNICGDKCPGKGAPCACCSHRNCNRICPQVEFVTCKKRLCRPGKVCNGCLDEKQCHIQKVFYIAKKAHNDYVTTLRESRTGSSLLPWEIEHLNSIISPKIRDGQSLHHICVTQAEHITRDERTIRRYLNLGLFFVNRGDLPRACMIKPRKSLAKEYQYKAEKKCYIGRTYEDYLAFLEKNPSILPVFMDLIEGRPGGKYILTLHWVHCAFMIGILIPNKCAASITAAFAKLYETLGHELFIKLFQVILTDRGTEFSAPTSIEFAPDGRKRTCVFFCDPMSPNQKSELERNHENFRKIFPKGTSCDNLTQEQLDLSFSHVNALVRLVRDDLTPTSLFEFFYGAETLAKLNIKAIDPREVILKPKLIGM